MTLHFIAFLLLFQTVCSEAFILKGNNIEKDKLHPAVKDLEDIEYQQAVLDPPIVINTFSEDIKSNCKSLREISRQSQLKVSSPSTKLTNKSIEKEKVDGFSQSIEDSEKTIKADYKKGAEKASEFFRNENLNLENKPINIKEGRDLTDTTNAKYNIRKDMNINNLSDSNESFNINLSMEQNGYQIEKPLPQSNGEISCSLIKINKTENINANKITFQSWENDNNTEYSNITSLVLDVVDSAGLNINMTENNTTDHDFSSTEQHDNQINKLKQNSVDSSPSSRQVENILKKECFNSYKNNKDDIKNNQVSSTTAGTISTEGEINLSRFHNNIMDINDIIRNENSLLISLQIEKPLTLKQSEPSSRKKRGIEGIYIIENQSKKVNSAEDEDGVIIEDCTEFNEDSSYAPLYEESSFIDANCIKHDTKDL